MRRQTLWPHHHTRISRRGDRTLCGRDATLRRHPADLISPSSTMFPRSATPDPTCRDLARGRRRLARTNTHFARGYNPFARIRHRHEPRILDGDRHHGGLHVGGLLGSALGWGLTRNAEGRGRLWRARRADRPGRWLRDRVGSGRSKETLLTLIPRVVVFHGKADERRAVHVSHGLGDFEDERVSRIQRETHFAAQDEIPL